MQSQEEKNYMMIDIYSLMQMIDWAVFGLNDKIENIDPKQKREIIPFSAL